MKELCVSVRMSECVWGGGGGSEGGRGEGFFQRSVKQHVMTLNA